MPTESLAELVRFAPDVYGFRWVNHVALLTEAGAEIVARSGPPVPALSFDAAVVPRASRGTTTSFVLRGPALKWLIQSPHLRMRA